MQPGILPTLGAAALSLIATACSGASDPKSLTDEGYTALNESRYDTAVASFDKALAGMDQADPLYLKASLGACEARVFVNAQKAHDDFLALAKSQASVTDKDYVLISGRLADAAELGLAVQLAESGKKRYPDSSNWDALINKLGRMAEASGNDDALAALKGLGYSGGD